MKPETVLLCVTGLSPAIVTETLWALAHEDPPVRPHRVVTVTTTTGARQIRQHLLSPTVAMGGQTVWSELRRALGAEEGEFIAEEPRLITAPNAATGQAEPLADIATPQENECAAEFILAEVRRLVENPDIHLVASLAGGRKTMGALLYAAMTLIGRETDRLTHVLVDPPYETLAGFFFPGQPGGPVEDRQGQRHDPAHARLQLADVPFVPLRNRFADLQSLPGNFRRLVQQCARTIKEDAQRPRDLMIDYQKKYFQVEGVAAPISVAQRCLALLHFLAETQAKGEPFSSQKELLDPLNAWLLTRPGFPTMTNLPPFDEESIRRTLSELRTALNDAASPWTIPQRQLHLPPHRLVSVVRAR